MALSATHTENLPSGFETIQVHNKENIHHSSSPLRSATTTILTRVVATAPPALDVKDALQAEMAQFEGQIADTTELDDPLEPYLLYIKWILKTFPNEQSAQPALVQLLEKCTSEFRDVPHYKQDPRYLGVWMRYIIYSKAPREMFSYLARKQIGCTLATFYEEYANHLEQTGFRRQAKQVFEAGINAQARPIDRLRRKYREFADRLAINPPDQNEPSSPPPLPQTSRPLKPLSTKHEASTSAGCTDKSKLTIFKDPVPGTALSQPDQVNGRRPEKIAIALEFLHDENGEEYCLEEVLARSRKILDLTYPLETQTQPQKQPLIEDDTLNNRPPASPTMTMHTKAATEEIYEMFNQPLQTESFSGSSSEHEEEYDEDYEEEESDDGEDLPGTSMNTLNTQAHDLNINNENSTPAKSAATTGRYAPNFPPMTPIAEATETISESTVRKANNNFSKNYPSHSPYMITDAICDPTTLAHKDLIMSHSTLTQNPNFHYNAKKSFGKKDMLRKTFMSRRKSETHKQLPTIRFPGTGEMYSIRKILGEGGFGCVYLAESELGEIRAIKVENTPNPWECYILNLIYHKFAPNHSRELESVIHSYSMYLFRDESFLTLEYLDQGTVLDAVNISRQQTGSGLEECLVIYLTIELLRIIEALHEAQIIHGDIKPDNVMLNFKQVKESGWDRFYRRDGTGGWSSKGVKLIDFGRAIDMSAYRPDVQFMADWKMDEQDCVEMRENRPWTYQADYHGIAGVVHCLLFGKFIHITELQKTNRRKSQGSVGGNSGSPRLFGLTTPFKRYWQQPMWTELFHTLLNSQALATSTTTQPHQPQASLPITPTIKAIRIKFEKWLEENCESGTTSLKTAIKKIESALLDGYHRRPHR